MVGWWPMIHVRFLKNGPFFRISIPSSFAGMDQSDAWTKPRSSQLGLLASYGMPGEPLGPKRHALVSSGNPRKIYPQICIKCWIPPQKNGNLMTPDIWQPWISDKKKSGWHETLRKEMSCLVDFCKFPRQMWGRISKSIRITQKKTKNKTTWHPHLFKSLSCYQKWTPKRNDTFLLLPLPWCANALGEGSKGCRKAATLLCLNSSGFSKKSIPLKPHRIDSWFCWGKCTKINIIFF